MNIRVWPLWLMVALAAFLLSSCNETEHEHLHTPAIPKIEADLITEPSPPTVNTAVRIASHITGLSSYKDVEVSFELNTEGQEREVLKAKHETEGVFAASKTFETSGNYTVTIHLNTLDFHQSIKSEIVVQ